MEEQFSTEDTLIQSQKITSEIVNQEDAVLLHNQNNPLFDDSIFVEEFIQDKESNTNNSMDKLPFVHELKSNAEIYQKYLEHGDYDMLNGFRKSKRANSHIVHDIQLYNFNLDNQVIPEVEIPSVDLAIGEEGAIPKASLIELVGAIYDVYVVKTYNRKTPDNKEYEEKRRVKWDEVSHYGLNKETCDKLFSKSVIKQFLLMHMLPIDSEGYVFDVPYKQVADYLNVSVRTVKNNLKILEENKFIKLTPSVGMRKKHFDFTLLHYEQKLEKSYIKMSKPTFDTFLKIEDVNALRLGLRMYQRSIEKLARVDRLSNTAPKFDIEEIRCILPEYKVYPKAIEEMQKSMEEIFNNKLIDSELYFKIDKEQIPTTHQVRVYETINETIIAMLNKGLMYFYKKDKEDLLQLINQYGLAKTINNVKRMMADEKTLAILNKPDTSTDALGFGMVLRSLLDFNKSTIAIEKTPPHIIL